MNVWIGALFLCLIAAQSKARDCHYSWWSDNPQRYLQAIREAHLVSPLQLPVGERIRAGIVTHHFLASGLMVRFFEGLSKQSEPDTIILIGPNHFHHGLANISVSALPWKTPFGVLETDRRVVHEIQKAVDLPEDTEAFTGEHSVGVLVPFIKYYFPHARVVTILVDVNARQDKLNQLLPVLSRMQKDPTILTLLSMDFSHDTTSSVADARDEQAERVISAVDDAKTRNLNVDCPKGLWLLLAELKRQGTVKVQIKEHTNSSRLTGKTTQSDVTSYFSVFFTSTDRS